MNCNERVDRCSVGKTFETLRRFCSLEFTDNALALSLFRRPHAKHPPKSWYLPRLFILKASVPSASSARRHMVDRRVKLVAPEVHAAAGRSHFPRFLSPRTLEED